MFSVAVKTLVVLVPLLVSIAFITLAERKALGLIQVRRGPNLVGFVGLFQPLADGLKLFTKEVLLPNHINFYIFLLSPVLSLGLALLAWGVIPFGGLALFEFSLGVLYV